MGLTLVAALVAGLLQTSFFHGLFYVSYVAVELMWVYAIYWAFSIRHLLSASAYRNQALGIGLVALVWLVFNFAFYLENNLVLEVVLSVAMLVTFYWIDASILASRKSDPLYRDTFHWRESRLALWPAIVVILVILFPSWQLTTGTSAIIGASPSLFSMIAISGLVFLLIGSGLVWLLGAAVRSRDRVFRRSLLWFGIFVLGYFGLLTAWAYSGVGLLNVLAYIVASYSVYKSVKSLAPISAIPKLVD